MLQCRRLLFLPGLKFGSDTAPEPGIAAGLSSLLGLSCTPSKAVTTATPATDGAAEEVEVRREILGFHGWVQRQRELPGKWAVLLKGLDVEPPDG